MEENPIQPGSDPTDSRRNSAPTEPNPALSNPDRNEIFKALEIVEKDSIAIAESYASLFASLSLALSEVTSTSLENMRSFGAIIGSVQEAALDAATKGNRYINSCLRLSEELKNMETLALQLKVLRRNVDALDIGVDHLLRLP